jgi:hypothetical protein
MRHGCVEMFEVRLTARLLLVRVVGGHDESSLL